MASKSWHGGSHRCGLSPWLLCVWWHQSHDMEEATTVAYHLGCCVCDGIKVMTWRKPLLWPITMVAVCMMASKSWHGGSHHCGLSPWLLCVWWHQSNDMEEATTVAYHHGCCVCDGIKVMTWRKPPLWPITMVAVCVMASKSWHGGSHHCGLSPWLLCVWWHQSHDMEEATLWPITMVAVCMMASKSWHGGSHHCGLSPWLLCVWWHQSHDMEEATAVAYHHGCYVYDGIKVMTWRKPPLWPITMVAMCMMASKSWHGGSHRCGLSPWLLCVWWHQSHDMEEATTVAYHHGCCVYDGIKVMTWRKPRCGLSPWLLCVWWHQSHDMEEATAVAYHHGCCVYDGIKVMTWRKPLLWPITMVAVCMMASKSWHGGSHCCGLSPWLLCVWWHQSHDMEEATAVAYHHGCCVCDGIKVMAEVRMCPMKEAGIW